MRIIIITSDNDETRISNLGEFIKNNYNIKYFFTAPTKNSIMTHKILKDFINVPNENNNKLNIKFKKELRTKDNDSLILCIDEAKKELSDIDLSERTKKYKELYEILHEETDKEIGEKLNNFYYNNLLVKMHQLNELNISSVDLGAIPTSCDIAVICDFIVANSIIEEIYKINKYHAYARSADNKIYANISVINTESKLLEFYNYSYFIKTNHIMS
jgi:hypothetical protein